MKEIIERIKIEVVVELNYSNKKERAEAVKKAKNSVLSQSILGSVGVKPIKAKLIKLDVRCKAH